MSSDNEDLSPSGIPSQLTSSVSSLRQTLSPLLNKPWSDSVDKLSALKRAEMDVMMAYTLVDLVWGTSVLLPRQSTARSAPLSSRVTRAAAAAAAIAISP